MHKPFQIIPWGADFLKELYDIVEEETHGFPQNAVLVFPLNRPQRYLLDIYRKKITKPTLLPLMLNSAQLIQICLESWAHSGVPRYVGTLEEAAILRDCILNLKNSGKGSINSLVKILKKEDGMSLFYPWALRLSALLDECAMEMKETENFHYVDDLVSPFAVTILENLKSIQRAHTDRLLDAGLSTQGNNARLAAELSKTNPELPFKLKNKSIFIAGFVRPSEAEKILFHYLWERGAQFCLHTDPGIIVKKTRWSCSEHMAWINAWGASPVLRGNAVASSPEPHFFSGYDLHSQLFQLQRDLEKDNGKGSRAVILSQDSLLMPVLHHIKEKNINISLGYPLSRTRIALLLERIMLLQEKKSKDGRVHWKEFLELIQHPYVRMLRTESKNTEEEKGIRPLLFLLEDVIRTGGHSAYHGLQAKQNHFSSERASRYQESDTPLRFFDPEEFTEEFINRILDPDNIRSPEGADDDRTDLLKKVVSVFITKWNDIATPQDLADALRGICELLLTAGKNIWPKFPLDAECLARLMQHLIPELADSSLANDTFGRDALFSILRQNLEGERVPFNADPLEGLQILGMLETRLLNFDTVYLPDFTEDNFPGTPKRDPLLPDGLRRELKLPDTTVQERIADHNFHSLIASAKNVFYYWQVDDGKFGGKKEASRHIEEALWQKELTWAREHNDTPFSKESILRQVSFGTKVPRIPTALPIERTPTLDAAVQKLLEKPISATLLNAYLRCPVAFLFSHILRIQDPSTVLEGDDPMGVGTFLHEILYDAYEKVVGKNCGKDNITDEDLKDIFKKKWDEDTLKDRIPVQSRFMLEASIPYRLNQYLKQQKKDAGTFEPLALEQNLTGFLETGWRRCSIQGKIDRIDRRNGKIILLDYKTGKTNHKLSTSEKEFWEDGTLWDLMKDWQPESYESLGQKPVDPFAEVSQKLKDVQLPFYLYLFSQNSSKFDGLEPSDAAWIDLGVDGKEKYLLQDKSDEEKSEIIHTKIPILLGFLVRHMALCKQFTPSSESKIHPESKARPESERCRHCSYEKICKRNI